MRGRISERIPRRFSVTFGKTSCPPTRGIGTIRIAHSHSLPSRATAVPVPHNNRQKQTGAAILAFRAMTLLQAAPAAYPDRSAWESRPVGMTCSTKTHEFVFDANLGHWRSTVDAVRSLRVLPRN
jgi:hypothetical protein